MNACFVVVELHEASADRPIATPTNRTRREAQIREMDGQPEREQIVIIDVFTFAVSFACIW